MGEESRNEHSKRPLAEDSKPMTVILVNGSRSKARKIAEDLEEEMKTVSFMDLPAELRNPILELVVVKQTPYFWLAPSFRYRAAAKTKLPNTSSALARVSKSVASQVLPLLYGRNTFNIYPECLDHCLGAIGSNVQYIRHLCLWESWKFGSPKGDGWIPPKLDLATRLRSLAISHPQLCGFDPDAFDQGDARSVPGTERRARILDALLPALKAIQRSMQEGEEDLSYSVLDIVKVVPCSENSSASRTPCIHDFTNGSDNIMQHCKNVEKAFREAVAEALGIEHAGRPEMEE